MTTTTSTPQALEGYVRDALRNNGGHKVSDLTDAQRERALTAPRDHSGLRGKALAEYVISGASLREQQAEAQRAREALEAAEARERRSAQASTRPSPYSDAVRAATKRARELRGGSHGIGPKQTATVREVVRKELGVSPKDQPDAGALVKIAGMESVAELFSVAAGEGDRTATKPLRPLGEKMGDDAWCKGRWLAAILAAWHEEITA